jgi:2-polyprenyl-3-methyl-5-hydroxy-6-metoxy-1,4-benzoquinol methylase
MHPVHRSEGRTAPTLAQALNEHHYPRRLYASRLALRAFHAAIHVTTLRSWYVRRALRRHLPGLCHGATIVDLGCGSGDHLFYTLRRRPDLRGIGIDRSETCVALCRHHAPPHGAARAEFRHQNLDENASLPGNEMTLCIGMLQYVEYDYALLRAARASLSDSGRLLLYVPVRNERLTRFYRRFVEGGGQDYDAVQKRRRVYEPDDVQAMLRTSGLVPDDVEFSYGWFGKLAFELRAGVLHGLLRGGAVVRMAAALAGLLGLPAFFVLMAADYLLPVRRGNGMVVVARPSTAPGSGIFQNPSRT